MKRSKRYEQLSTIYEQKKAYSLADALELLKKFGNAKFDETVELIANIGVDPKQADQQVRGTVSLPHGTGKKIRVIVFAQGEKLLEAEKAGADAVGGDDLVKRIQDGWLDFDIALATPDMMKVVSKLGKVLGPRGLMPNPKSGTVTFDLSKAISDFKAGKIEYRVDRNAGIHVLVGKISFAQEALKENILTVMTAIMRARPTAAKGQYLKSAYLATTMSPGIKLDISGLREDLRAA